MGGNRRQHSRNKEQKLNAEAAEIKAETAENTVIMIHYCCHPTSAASALISAASALGLWLRLCCSRLFVAAFALQCLNCITSPTRIDLEVPVGYVLSIAISDF